MLVVSGEWLVASTRAFTTEDIERTEKKKQLQIDVGRADSTKSKDPPHQKKKKAEWATLTCKFIAINELTGWATRQKKAGRANISRKFIFINDLTGWTTRRSPRRRFFPSGKVSKSG